MPSALASGWGEHVPFPDGAAAAPGAAAFGLGPYHGFDDPIRAVVGTAFVGAYTTFSTFSYETIRLLGDGLLRQALLNITLSLGGGLAAATTGMLLVAVLWP